MIQFIYIRLYFEFENHHILVPCFLKFNKSLVFLTFFYGPSAKRSVHEHKEGKNKNKNEDP